MCAQPPQADLSPETSEWAGLCSEHLREQQQLAHTIQRTAAGKLRTT
jgi:hypothetical protein